MQCASSTATSVGLRLASISGKPGTLSRSGGDEEEVEVSPEVAETDLAAFFALAAGVNAFGAEAHLLELGDLVLHERDQGADDQGDAAAGDAGELVAEGFAGAGGHDQQHVPALGNGLADFFLVRAE